VAVTAAAAPAVAAVFPVSRLVAAAAPAGLALASQAPGQEAVWPAPVWVVEYWYCRPAAVAVVVAAGRPAQAPANAHPSGW